ncbi:MAG TPA: glucose-6-phosphate isomerase family protein [Rectinemataceae bacterium]|nr:glucose-6-phosphate isomerase family protein [Rectinemataceae bacterium]
MEENIPYITPFLAHIDLAEGAMTDFTARTERKASSMRGHYQDSAALERIIADGDPVHYEVFEKPVPETYGNLMFCVSTLQPGLVGNEYFMTKGHYHSLIQTGEIYLCLRGKGLMIMKTKDGGFTSLPMERGAMVYVPPYWAHRSVNVGSEPLVSFCVYNAEAGHNYGDIETEGFIKRVFNEKGQAVIR